jgi:protein SCO1/2
MKQNKNIKFLLGLTVALLLPFTFYAIAKILKKDQIVMPQYYSEVVNGDTLYNKIPEIIFENQMGDSITFNNDLKGKVLVISVFFTNCNTICPNLMDKMKVLQKAFKRNDTTVQLISISIDPERDSVAALRAYAQDMKADFDHWWFLRNTNQQVVANFLRNDLKLYANQSSSNSAENLDHTPTIVLIDKNRFIRGYYNGTDLAELNKCAEDIGLLAMEKRPKHQ